MYQRVGNRLDQGYKKRMWDCCGNVTEYDVRETVSGFVCLYENKTQLN